MKNRQTLSAVLLTALIAALAYIGISRGPVAREASPAGLALGQAPTNQSARLASPPAVALPVPVAANTPFPFRLKNTDAPIGELVRNETAVLLRNAFIDTALGSRLAIPAELKTTGDPLTYIVQSRGPATAAFRRHISASGGKIISYIPNNAYLVRVDAVGASRLVNWSGTQSVLAFEPYYKLEMKLLEMALTGQALPERALLNVVLFPNSEPAAAKRLAKLGVEVLSQDRTPFGAKLVARVPADKLAALARLTEVQGLERHRQRRLANDLTRPRLGVDVFNAETNVDGEVTKVWSTNHLGLTGNRIYVNVNDTGVDGSHAAFGKRIKGSGEGKDPDGHGTFVAGIIAGDGVGSDTIKTNPPPGSFEDPDFKGMAIKAKLHVLKYSDSNVNNHVSDRWLQTESADYHYFQSPKQKYTLISNNSWEYEDESDYTWAAASYDAATRDALPEQPGDQQVIYVFPAGNSGSGTDNGLNASPNTITAPGTAKNVITVGAIETLREVVAESYTSVTNTVTETDEDGNEVEKEEVTTTTNTPFAGMSDSDNQVAAFSSRGNVGIGIEGAFGRFKPDLVAPGTFIISTRSADWKNSITSTNAQADADALEKQNDELGDQYRYESGTSVAAPAISGMLALMEEFYHRRLTGRNKRTNSPALMKALLINSAQSVDARYDHNVRGTVNHQGWGLPNLGRAVPALADENPNDEAAWPMQFIDQSLTNALATGESRSWEITLGTNAMHYPLRFTLAWTDPPGNPNAAVKLVNDLDLIVTPISDSPLGQGAPLDPVDPDDEPADTTTDTNEVYYGNNIGASVYSTMGLTNDVINNVENVFIEEPSAEKYRITVYARRVNVDSLSAFYDADTRADHVDVVQDFALVMSSANPEVKDAFLLKEDKPEEIELPAITTLTNGMPMLNQRVGANSPLAKTNDPSHTVFANRRGITNQWHFYTFTNAPPETTNQSGTTPGVPATDDDDDDNNQPSFGRHVAFITFMSPNLSTPRYREADIDLYVSRDSNLTNLEPAVLDAAFRSTGRGGTEYITFDDAKVGKDEVFYIGVKSEDQMAAEFGLVGLSTDNANGFMDEGNLLMMPMPAIIPDGSAANPGGVSVFGIYTGMPYDTVRKVTATSIIHHEEVGDLWGQLSHNRDAVVLNNHTLAELVTGKPYPTDFVFIYDDESVPASVMPGSIPTDGPGSLNDFKWQPAMGVWQFDIVDSALSFTGLVQHLNVNVDAIPDLSLIGDRGIDVHLDPDESKDFLVEVPFNATNMIVQLTEMTGPVDVYIRKDIEPDLDKKEYDKSTVDAAILPGPDGEIGTEDDIVEWDGSPPRGELHYGLNDSPRGIEGRWFVTIDNPEITGVDFHLKVIFEYDISLDNTINLVSDGPETIDDDIVTTSRLTVTNDFLVGSAEIGVRIDHPRLADLDLHLVSPQGTRLLLAENRGHTNIAYGMMLTEETGTVPVFEDGFESADNDFIDDSAMFHSGWELESGEVYAYRSGEVAGLKAHSGVQFLEMNGFEPGTISTNALTEADKTYRLQFAYAKNPDADEPLEMKVFVGSVTNLTVTASIEAANNTLSWQMQDVVFTAKSANTQIRFQSLEPDVYAVMLDSVRLDEVTPATLYAVFSELENLAKASMKFGDAPYAKENEQVLFSGFEGETVGLVKTNDIVDGWTVINSKVRVSQSIGAHSGNYYAMLSYDSASEAKEGGAIWRDLPTAVGQDYRLSFVTHAAGNDAEYLLGGVVTNRVEGAISLTNAIPQSADWVTNTVRFTAARSSTPLTIRTESAAVRLDTVELIGPGPHNLAEEALDVLSGERAMGDWVLEVRDRRVGLDDTDTEIEPMLISWYIKIMGSEVEDTEVTPEGSKPYTRDDTAEALKEGKKVRGRIYDNETHYWTVETCSDSSKLTVELSSVKKRRNAKVSLLASYGGFPSGDTKADDYIQVDMNDSYFANLVIGDTGHLPLQPGELLYLTVQKTDTNVTERALYDIVAKWDGDCGGGSPPNASGDIIRLANATGSELFQSQPGTPTRFLWSIPAGTPAALLEATGLTADADIELISTDGLHYRNSIHLGPAPEQIVLREDDTIPSLEGDWVVQVNTVGDAPSEFTLYTTLADEQDHLISPLPIELEIESQFWPPTVRLAWPSVPGELYVLESSKNLIDWVSVHEKSAGSSGVVFHAERSWFGERYYRVKQITNGR